MVKKILREVKIMKEFSKMEGGSQHFVQLLDMKIS